MSGMDNENSAKLFSPSIQKGNFHAFTHERRVERMENWRAVLSRCFSFDFRGFSVKPARLEVTMSLNSLAQFGQKWKMHLECNENEIKILNLQTTLIGFSMFILENIYEEG